MKQKVSTFDFDLINIKGVDTEIWHGVAQCKRNVSYFIDQTPKTLEKNTFYARYKEGKIWKVGFLLKQPFFFVLYIMYTNCNYNYICKPMVVAGMLWLQLLFSMKQYKLILCNFILNKKIFIPWNTYSLSILFLCTLFANIILYLTIYPSSLVHTN